MLDANSVMIYLLVLVILLEVSVYFGLLLDPLQNRPSKRTDLIHNVIVKSWTLKIKCIRPVLFRKEFYETSNYRYYLPE